MNEAGQRQTHPEPIAMPISMTRGDALLQGGIEDGLFSHAAYGVRCRGEEVARRAFGKASLSTQFDLASLTKPMATATLLMQSVEQGRLHLRQSVARFFEDEFGPLPHLTGMEVRHLLTHTSGLPPIPCWPADPLGVSRRDLVASVLATPTLRPAGAGYTYSDTGFILLGEIIARIHERPLEACFQNGVAAPLGLKTLRFLPSASNDIAPTGPEAAGRVHDPRARDLGGAAGHAGLFGTAADVLAFAEVIRTGGGSLLSPASAARMAVTQIPLALGAQSLGWFCSSNDYLPQGDLFSDRSFGHSGFTGTALLIDPAADISLTLLTNRVINQTEDGSRFLRLRRLWLNTAASALL